MDFCSGLQGPSLCCNEYSGTPNRNKSPRTGTNHPGWARCLAVTETTSVSVNLYRATCKLVRFFPCKLKASVVLSRKPFNFQPKLILISLHFHFFVPALLTVSLVYFLRTLGVFFFPFGQMFCCTIPDKLFVNMYYQIYTWCSQWDLGSPLWWCLYIPSCTENTAAFFWIIIFYFFWNSFL